MSEPELSDEETRTLIDYARRKFAAERWPLSPALRPVRAVMEKLDPKPEPQPRGWVNSIVRELEGRGPRSFIQFDQRGSTEAGSAPRG